MSIVAMTLDCNPASAVSAQPQETSDGSTCHPPCRFGGDIDRGRPAPMLAAMMVRWRIAVQGRNTSARSVEDRNLRVDIVHSRERSCPWHPSATGEWRRSVTGAQATARMNSSLAH